MASRINTRNFENGSKMSTASWSKYISRHCQFWSKDEMMGAHGQDVEAAKAIEKHFSPFVHGEHVYLNLPDGQTQICLGYVDEVEGGGFMATQNSDYGGRCMTVSSIKAAISTLNALYNERA